MAISESLSAYSSGCYRQLRANVRMVAFTQKAGLSDRDLMLSVGLIRRIPLRQCAALQDAKSGKSEERDRVPVSLLIFQF